MTSLNISLPEALKEYIQGQVASGDWGTPSEYVRELIRQDKERRLGNLEQDLIAAANGPKIELPVQRRFARKNLLACFGSGLDACEETSDRSLRHFLNLDRCIAKIQSILQSAERLPYTYFKVFLKVEKATARSSSALW